MLNPFINFAHFATHITPTFQSSVYFNPLSHIYIHWYVVAAKSHVWNFMSSDFDPAENPFIRSFCTAYPLSNGTDSSFWSASRLVRFRTATAKLPFLAKLISVQFTFVDCICDAFEHEAEVFFLINSNSRTRSAGDVDHVLRLSESCSLIMFSLHLYLLDRSNWTAIRR